MINSRISSRLWNLCHVLRDDGIVYHKYLSELTYLLFLKIADESGSEGGIPEGCRWRDLISQKTPGILSFYRKMLTKLGEDAPDHLVREIFSFPTTVFSHDENLEKVVRELDKLDWHTAKLDGLGNIYENLLERNAAEARSGAGQYFTPRPLVDSLVRLLKPTLGETIQDPASGTGGFLISADQYIREQNGNTQYLNNPPQFQGVEIENDTYRLCLMNIFLHEMQGKIIHGDALTEDASALAPADVIIANPPFGSGSGGARPRRKDLPFATSNKQLLFLQHIYHSLIPGGRAAVVLPDNVLFEDGVGRRIRDDLMTKCVLHAILRLPSGIFYAAGVNTNVLIFTRSRNADERTDRVWVYDLRTNMTKFNKGRPISAEDFSEFEEFYAAVRAGNAPPPSPEDRHRAFSRQEIEERNNNLDMRWLRERGSQDDFVGSEPGEIAMAIADLLRSALAEVDAIAGELDSAQSNA